MRACISAMNVVLPEPQSPNSPTDSGGTVSRAAITQHSASTSGSMPRWSTGSAPTVSEM